MAPTIQPALFKLGVIVADKAEIISALQTVLDPELYIDVWTLGLVYDLNLDGSSLNVRMTFTSIGCPAGPYLVKEIREKLLALPGIEKVQVDVVFDPPWEPSEELKASLGLY